jgi:predicted Zn finger-like uncharacterized protein
MIIECTNCNKKFNVESSLIPKSGRNIQCGSCNHIWFYKEKENTSSDSLKINPQNILNEEKIDEIVDEGKIDKIVDKEKIDEIFDEEKYKENIKSNTLNFNKILSYLIVGIISFTAFIIILDTFKSPLTNTFPNLELFLLNLLESLKDIFLFVKNLLQ